jgi:hypothetical protein
MNRPSSGSRYITEGEVRSGASSKPDPRQDGRPSLFAPCRLKRTKSSRSYFYSGALTGARPCAPFLMRPEVRLGKPGSESSQGVRPRIGSRNVQVTLTAPTTTQAQRCDQLLKLTNGVGGLKACCTTTPLTPGRDGCCYGERSQVLSKTQPRTEIYEAPGEMSPTDTLDRNSSASFSSFASSK